MDIIDYFAYSFSRTEFTDTLIMLFGEETVEISCLLCIISIKGKTAHLIIN